MTTENKTIFTRDQRCRVYLALVDALGLGAPTTPTEKGLREWAWAVSAGPKQTVLDDLAEAAD